MSEIRGWWIAVVTMLFVALLGGARAMAALSENYDAEQRSMTVVNLTVSNGVTIYAGSLVAVTAAGEAVAATDVGSQAVVGRAAEKVDNTSDGETIDVDIGVFRYENSGTFTDGNIGDLCYVLDNDRVTTAAIATNDMIAGLVVDVDSDGVWVQTMDVDRTAGSFTTLAASGAAAFSSTTALGGDTTIATAKHLKSGGNGTGDLGDSTNGFRNAYIEGRCAVGSEGQSAVAGPGNGQYQIWATNVSLSSATGTVAILPAFAAVHGAVISYYACPSNTTLAWLTSIAVGRLNYKANIATGRVDIVVMGTE